MKKIFYLWAPGTWEVEMFRNENPAPKKPVGLGLWLFDDRFPDRLPRNIFEPFMLCPPGYSGSFGPIPAMGPSGFNPFSALRAPSYEVSVDDGVTFAVAQIETLPMDDNIVLGGYSQGAQLISELVREFASGRLKHRLHQLKAVYTFGNPCRFQDRTFPNGNMLPWHGIAKDTLVETPPGVLWRDYAFYDDMYANANPNSYLFDFYATLTDLQFNNPWKAVQDLIINVGKTDLMKLAGANPTSPMWVIGNIPFFISASTKAVNTISAAARFASSGAHGHYHDWHIIPGFSPIFHSIRSAKYLAKGLGYAVPGI
jgi:hypothetical protein